MSRRSMLLAGILTFSVLASCLSECGSSLFNQATPTPRVLLPASDTPDDYVYCGDLVVVSVRQARVNELAGDLFSPNENEVQVLAVLADAEGRAPSQFNYHLKPASLQAGSEVELGRFHAAIEVQDQEPVYVWLLVVDNDEFTFPQRVGASLASSFGTYVLEYGAAFAPIPGGPLVIGTVADSVLDEAKHLEEQPDTIGDIAFVLGPDDNWNEGYYEETLGDGAVDLSFTIRHYAGCNPVLQTMQGDFQGNPALQLNQCNSQSPATRLQHGDMAIVSVPAGRHLFFRPEPTQSKPGIRYVPGHLMRVVGGPACENDIMFWQVLDYRGREGWMAESEIIQTTDQGVYYLTPFSP